MGKPKTPRALKDNEARAVLRMLRISPQKLNLVAQLIRGKKVEKALAELEFSHKRIAVQVKKVLESAIANAEIDPRVRNGALGYVGAVQDLPAYTSGGSTLLVFALPHGNGVPNTENGNAQH